MQRATGKNQSRPCPRWRLKAEGLVKILAVRFFAWGALAFLKNTAGRPDVTRVDLDPTWQRVVQRASILVQGDNYQKAVEEIEDFLIGLRLNILFDPKQVRTAAKLLYHTRGQFRVAELSDHCQLSMRQLQRQFDETTGVSPKELARAIRFESIRERLMFDPKANLTDLAYEFGYADQAHFIKDFKAFTDKTPGEFAFEMQQLKNIFSENENVVFLQSPCPPCLITMRSSCSKQAQAQRRRKMILNNLITSLLVKDYDEAISFYSGKLGFVVVEDVPMGPDRWVTVALPNSHETVFALHVAKSDSDLALVGKQGGSFPFIGITTDDCPGEYRRLKALGVNFQGEPEVRPYGTGVMLEDLYGNKVFLNQEPANQAAKTASS